MPQAVEMGFDRLTEIDLDAALVEFLDDFDLQLLIELEAHSGTCTLARSGQGPPARGRDLFDQRELQTSAGVWPPREETGRDDFGVVDDQEITFVNRDGRLEILPVVATTLTDQVQKATLSPRSGCWAMHSSGSEYSKSEVNIRNSRVCGDRESRACRRPAG